MRLLASISCVVLSLSLITGCTTSPTGRSQLNLFGNTLDKQGIAAFTALKQKVPTSTNPATNQLVQCVVDSLTPVVDAKYSTQNWEVVVFDDEQVNAFAVPGGKIGVYTGILNVAQTPDQLAAIIGHEIGHVIAQHASERASIQLGTQAFLLGTQAAMQANEVSVAEQQTYMSILGLGTQVGVNLPYSRTHESEADLIGLELLVLAGYSPYAAVELWQNMSAAKDGQKVPPELLSTHPSAETRIRDLQDAIPKVVKQYAGQTKNNNC